MLGATDKITAVSFQSVFLKYIYVTDRLSVSVPTLQSFTLKECLFFGKVIDLICIDEVQHYML